MGKADISTQNYMKKNAHFADAFNYYLYHGKQVINPDDLAECDVTELALPHGLGKKTMQVKKIRDVLKRCVVKRDKDTTYLLLGIENQSDIHYAMPVRNMLYDALNYAAQVSETASENRKEKDWDTSEEFLSGLKKTDKLIPVITLVIYFKAGKWDGPRSLHEMLSVRDREILKYVSDYKLNLIIPSEIEHLEQFKTELKYMLGFIKESGSKKELVQYMEQNKKVFEDMDKESIDMVNVCTGADIPYRKREEELMCVKQLKR